MDDKQIETTGGNGGAASPAAGRQESAQVDGVPVTEWLGEQKGQEIRKFIEGEQRELARQVSRPAKTTQNGGGEFRRRRGVCLTLSEQQALEPDLRDPTMTQTLIAAKHGISLKTVRMYGLKIGIRRLPGGRLVIEPPGNDSGEVAAAKLAEIEAAKARVAASMEAEKEAAKPLLIEKGIVIPPIAYAPGRFDIIRKMQVGDSIFFPRTPRKVVGSALAARRRRLGFSFTLRTVEGGVRAWRIG
jgi:hypothetical protein